MGALLEVIGISKVFGGLTALHHISPQVEQGRIVGIIGPNGAGKTTLFNCLTGLHHPTEGRILFEERPLVEEPSKRKIRLVRGWAAASLLLSLFWAPLVWSLGLPRSFFKFEWSLLVVLLFALRHTTMRGLHRSQVRAWATESGTVDA